MPAKSRKKNRSPVKLKMRHRRFRKKMADVGARPGTLVEHTINECSAQLIEFVPGADEYVSRAIDDVAQLPPSDSNRVHWLDIQGLGDLETIEAVGKRFQIHPLALADAVNVPQRPKTDIYGDQILVVMRMVCLAKDQSVQTEQVTLLIGNGYVVTFQEKPGDILDPLRKRLTDPTSRVRNGKAGFLAYAIVDTIIDGYYPVIDVLGDHIESLESRVMSDPSTDTLVELNHTKNLLVDLRRSISPQREAINALIREQHPGISDDVRIHLRDVYDHCIQSLEVIEMYREMSTGLISIYLSAVANRSNDVMKVLTIMASVFIPLTFIAGIYGMNFEYMPELKFRWAYPLVWVAMIAISGGMLAIFWRKGWLGK